MKTLFISFTCIVLSLGLCSCFSGCQKRTLTLVSYNVGAFSKEDEDSSQDIAVFLKDIDAYTAALNEVDSCNTRHNVNQAANLASLLGPEWSYSFGRAIEFAGGSYGNAVVSRETVLRGGNLSLPQLDGCEQRSCTYIETADYVFAAVHLDHVSEEARLAQLAIVTSSMKELYKSCRKPVFLAGDFNAEPGSVTLNKAEEDWDVLTPAEYSYSAKNPRKCIDYIMQLKGSGKIEVIAAGTLAPTTATGIPLSDHLPLYIKISL